MHRRAAAVHADRGDRLAGQLLDRGPAGLSAADGRVDSSPQWPAGGQAGEQHAGVLAGAVHVAPARAATAREHAARADSDSGRSGGQRRSPRSSPPRRSIARTRSTWIGSAEWLAATSARSAGSARPARRAASPRPASACWTSAGRSPRTGHRPRRPPAGRVEHRDRAVVAALDEAGPDHLGERHRRRRYGAHGRAGTPSSARACAGRHRRALGQPGERGRPRDELGVALHRLPLGVRDRVLHADPQVAAGRERGEQHRQRGAADAGGRERGALGQVAQRLRRRRPGPAVPGMPPGTPMTKSTCTWPPDGSPYLSSSRSSVVSWPRSKISYSGTMPRSCIRVCRSTMNSHRLRNTSSPKLTVPIVQEAISGPASSTASRSASGSVTAPPEESWTIRSGRLAQRGRRWPAAGPGRASGGPRRRGCGRG